MRTAFVLAAVIWPEMATGDEAAFTPAETRAIVALGPWPVVVQPDPSNRVSGKPAAIVFGRSLFADPRLSGPGTIACASCHRPELAFADGQARAAGIDRTDRNTIALANLRLARWYGWDGAADNLWAQSLRPLLEPREMGSGFGHLGALARGDAAAAARYPAAARRGLALFVGRGRCNACHLGPNFTNGEFHDAGMPHFAAPGRVDPGRYQGIRRVQGSPYNLLGPFNDDPAAATATPVRHVALAHRNFGEFRVPSLRNAACTAPYMHDGSLATLADVVRHYSELDLERLHADGERILQPLRLSPEESADLVAFLRTLADCTGGASSLSAD